MLERLLKRFWLLFLLGVGDAGEGGGEGEGVDADEGGEGSEGVEGRAPGDDDEDDDDDTLEETLEAGDDEQPTAKDRRRDSVKDAEARAERAEQLAAAERRARELLEQRQPGPTGPSDPDYEREQEIIRQAKERGAPAQEIADLEWAARTNQTLRNNSRKADAALFQAMEMEDKADFREVATTHPKRYKRYAARVETKLSELRKNGQNIKRRVLMRYLMGEDIDSGTVKVKTKSERLPENVTRIDRGRSPTMRSDVSGKGGKVTEHQKREARLLGKPI
jgi:hypothetical protein